MHILYRKSSQGNLINSLPKEFNSLHTCLLQLTTGCFESVSYDINPIVGSILNKLFVSNNKRVRGTIRTSKITHGQKLFPKSTAPSPLPLPY